MKKTISIHLGGSAFVIDEDAYALLDEYLSAIRSHFSDGEVVNDIEARIAERFSEKTGDRIIELHDVQTLITIMGRVEDIIGEADTAHESQSSHSDSSATRKLYRDYDNRVIEGVASGCAAYVGIDPTLMRIIFIIITLMSGFWLGVLAYVVLAIVLPKAVTPTEKMRMRGGPVTLSSFEQTLREKANDIESRHHIVHRTRELFSRLFQFVGTIIRGGGSVILRGVGGVIVGISLITLIIGTLVFVNALINSGAEYIRFPLFEVMSKPLFYSAVSLAFVLCAIPVGGALLVGIGLLRKRMIANAGIVFAILAGIWIVSLGATSVLWIRHGYNIEQRIESLPQFKTTQRRVSVEMPIHSVRAIDGVRVVVVTAPTQEITMTGSETSLQRIMIEQRGGTVTIRKADYEQNRCMFCGHEGRTTITISGPQFREIVAEKGAYVDVSDARIFGTILRARSGGTIRYTKTTEPIRSVIEEGGFIEPFWY